MKNNNISGGTSSGIYGLAFIGSLIYFLQHATDFWSVILAILKALAWPAMIAYHTLNFLQL